MKKRRGLLAAAATLALLSGLLAVHAETGSSGNATTSTFVTQAGSDQLVPTQDAYLTGDVLFLDSPLTMPEDIFVQGGRLYVADSGAGRIVSTDLSGGDVQSLGEGILSYPTGVFVTDAGEIYVADSGLQTVAVLSADGRLLRRYDRPQTRTFGANAQYQPSKVAVSDAGIIYIVSTGSFDGVIQLDQSGEFLGYYGYNNVQMSMLETIQNLIFTEEQLAQLFNKIPLAFYNLALDSKGMCYTVTQKTDTAPLKKHNIAGVNILNSSPEVENLADLCIGPDGQIFTVSESGMIYELDNNGTLLFAWGGQAANSERRGLFTLAAGIAVDEDCCLYVLDKERGVVHTFIPTEYASLMHTAIRQYEDGSYADSRDTLTRLAKLSGDVQMVNYYMGNNLMQLRDYEGAMESYRRAGDSAGYSDAFWEVRTAGVNQWFAAGALALAALVCGGLLLGRLRRRKARPAAPVYYYTDGRKAGEIGLGENLRFAFKFFKHPFNAFYEVKVGARGTVLSGTVLYLLAFATFAFYYAGRGFAFSQLELSEISPFYVMMLFFLPVGLFVLASYMVSEINNGEGTFKKMYAGMSYAMIPFICIAPVLTLLSHVITLSESFLISFGMGFCVVWSGVLVLLAIKEIHNYEPGQVAMNVLLALFLMIVMIFVGSIIGMFWDTVLDTLSAFGKEVLYRVTG